MSATLTQSTLNDPDSWRAQPYWIPGKCIPTLGVQEWKTSTGSRSVRCTIGCRPSTHPLDFMVRIR